MEETSKIKTLGASGGGWTAWRQFEQPPFYQGLRAGHNGLGQLQLIGRDSKDDLYTVRQTSIRKDSWTAPELLGQKVVAHELARNYQGHLALATLSTDGQLRVRHQQEPTGQWSAWQDMASGVLLHAIATNEDGRLELVYYQEAQGWMHCWEHTPGANWTGHIALGRATHQTAFNRRYQPGYDQLRPISIGRQANGQLMVFALNNDNRIYHISQGGPLNGWSDWVQFPIAQGYQLKVLSNYDGRLELFHYGNGRAAWHHHQTVPNGGWSNYYSRGGDISYIDAIRNGDGRLELFGINQQQELIHCYQEQPGGNWSGWLSLNLQAQEIASVINNINELAVFIITPDGKVCYSHQSSGSYPSPEIDKGAHGNNLQRLDDTQAKLSKIELSKKPAPPPKAKDHTAGTVSTIKQLAKHLDTDFIETLFDKTHLSQMLDLHSNTPDLTSHTLLQAHGKNLLGDLVSTTQHRLDETAESGSSTIRSMEDTLGTLTSSVEVLARFAGLTLPQSADQFTRNHLNKAELLPGAALKLVEDHLLSIDISDFTAFVKKLHGKTIASISAIAKDEQQRKEWIIGLAAASMVLKLISAGCSVVTRSLPLTVKVGANGALSGNVEGRGTVQADLSVGVDVGVGFSAPLAGVGADAEAGAGNTSLFDFKGLSLSLSTLILGPVIVFCSFATGILEMIIKMLKYPEVFAK